MLHDLFRDEARVATDAADRGRDERVLERAPDEVEPRDVGRDAAHLTRLATLVVDGHRDPVEAGRESRAPDDVPDVGRAAVREHRPTITNALHSRYELDPAPLRAPSA